MQTATTQRTAQPLSVKLPDKTVKAAMRAASATGITTVDFIAATVHSAAEHVREHRSISLPFKILPGNCLPVLIDGELRKSLESAADKNGTGLTWLVRLFAEYGLKQLERGNFRIVHPGEEKGVCRAYTPATPPAPPALQLPPGPRLRPGHLRKLLVVSELLNVRPQDLLDWHIGPVLDDFYNPAWGSLTDWAETNLVYPDPGERERVIARVNAWNARREMQIARRKPSAESGVEA